MAEEQLAGFRREGIPSRAVSARPTDARPLRVLLAGPLAALEAPGGGEVQMTATAGALRAEGVDARFWRPWEQSLDGADVLHLFGSAREHLVALAAARRRGLRVVVSTIAWFDMASYWRGARTWRSGLKACAALAARAAFRSVPSWRQALYRQADLLLPNSTAEARQLIRYFGVPAGRIHVVPNGADPRFASTDPEPFVRRYGLRGFVLGAGRIEPRKNQLGLLRAMRGTGVPIVLLGDPVPGHEAYLAACRREAGPQVHFVGRIDHDDPLLASAYAASACVVLASWFETPGLVALEAGMQGVPLVLPEPGCAREYFGDLARYVPPGDLRAIRRAVLQAAGQGRDEALAKLVQGAYGWAATARATREAYEKVC